MTRLKKFIITYWKYLVVGITIGLVVGLVIWVTFINSNQEELVRVENKPLPTPFWDNDNDFTWEMPQETTIIKDEKVYVYSILQYKEDIFNIVKEMDPDIQQTPELDIGMFWESDNSVITYNRNTGILVFQFKSKTNLGLITEATDVLSLIEKVFGYKVSQENIVVEDLPEGGVSYKGKYTIEDIPFGSIYLGTYSYVIEVTAQGNITKLSIFLYNPTSVNFYSSYSALNRSEITKTKSFMINNLSWSKNYQTKPSYLRVSTKLNTLEVKKITMAYVFKDFSHGYIFPIYFVEGNAIYEDWEKTMYRANTQLYMLATDPKYVVENKELQLANPD